LKQFTQLAGGALISLLFYASPLHPLIKWPLIIISFLFGVALAFLPIQDRPLTTWIVIFFRSIYSPTYFVWRKAAVLKEYFAPEEGVARAPAIVAAEKKEEKEELLQRVVRKTPITEKLEEKEKTFLSRVTENFIAPNTTVVISATPLHIYTPPQPMQTGIPSEVRVPETKPLEVEHVIIAKEEPEKGKPWPTLDISSTLSPMATQQISTTKASQFSSEEIPPTPPTRANIIVGQVLAPDGKIIEGAILEIKDSDGRPVRALKSNKLGHFTIATPLLSGRYEITTEKEGFGFEPVYFDAEDKIIPPIAVWAKKT